MESMENIYVIPVNGLASGRTEFEWSVGKEFFEEFGNTEVTEADLSVNVVAEKSGSQVLIDCNMDGVLTVPCDRCLSDLKVHISPHFSLSVKHSGDEASADKDGREVVILTRDDAFLDMSQVIYDYACLALPLHRVHKDGECDSSVADRIGALPGEEEDTPDEGSPFAMLKGMFD